jgi:predicted SAM-dependent methyltransferase
MIHLHLGCGNRYLPGFIHIDSNPFDHVDHICQLDDLTPIKTNSAGLIYASHCLEYFDLYQVDNVLQEWHRCLIPNGILRVAVPNFSKLVTVYKKTNDLNRILGPLFGRWPLKNGKNIYHRTVYDYDLLCNVMMRNGFGNIEEWDWRKELPDDYDDYSKAYYPHMDFNNGFCISLNLQATKREM